MIDDVTRAAVALRDELAPFLRGAQARRVRGHAIRGDLFFREADHDRDDERRDGKPEDDAGSHDANDSQVRAPGG